MNVKTLANMIADEDAKPFSPQEAAFFMRNAYEQHPKVVVEILQQLCSEKGDPYSTAYRVIMSGIRELAIGTSSKDFFAIVAKLNGIGSDRIKSDAVKLLNESIAAAEQSGFRKADAAEFAIILANIYSSSDTIRLQSKENSSFIILTTLQHILRHHPEGLKVIGNILANLTIDTANTPSSEIAFAALILGKVLGYVENALKAEFKIRDTRIYKGNAIVSFMADTVIAKFPASRDLMTNIKHGMIFSEFELPVVRLGMTKFRADIHRVVNETYRQTVDPFGYLVSGSLSGQEQKKYLDSFTTFETLMMRGRENVLNQKELRPTSIKASVKL